ncbi:MAG: SDR family NAD(P)-dependent oxidoreductase, partial [Lachnospiraceae bacterium]|nr:SDR family NAD(P)-dependent oxidoreductase [Lachnospiraceae bacterium]
GQTPQGFKKDVISEAYRRFFEDGNVEVTDDCGIVRHYGLADIYVVEGSEQNIKITYQEDIYLADKLFQIHSVESSFHDGDMKEVYKKLKGKTGVVFGAGGGIGADIVRIVREHGGSIYGFSRSNGCNICNTEQIKASLEKVYEEQGKIDYVINTAGELRIGKLESLSDEELERLIGVNYSGAVRLTKEALPYLVKSRGALLLFTSSSYTRGRALYSIYSSAKAAIVNFVQAMAEETEGDGVRINVINPERTDTPMRRKNFGNEPENTLLSSEVVAEHTIRAVLADYSGQVIDVRRKNS